jgi:hypothetical protein
MSISLISGNLYFIRDIDYLSREISKYVKIGIVTKQRTTEKRMKEHQTGNPRGIYEVAEIKDIPFVERLETHIHYEFNSRWITGEWFLFNDEELLPVIERAKQLKEEQLRDEQLVINALVTLSNNLSNGELLPYNDEANEIARNIINLQAELNILKAKISISKNQFYHYLGNNGIIEGVMRIKYTPESYKFNEDSFKLAHPEIYERCVVSVQPKIVSKFNVININKVTLSKLNLELYNQKKDLPKQTYSSQHINNTISRTVEIEKLHEEHMALLKEAKIKEFELEILTYKLQNKVGLYGGIEGVCKWKRELKHSEPAFDSALLKAFNPELYEEFCTKKSSVNFAMEIFPYRPYQPAY